MNDSLYILKIFLHIFCFENSFAYQMQINFVKFIMLNSMFRHFLPWPKSMYESVCVSVKGRQCFT